MRSVRKSTCDFIMTRISKWTESEKKALTIYSDPSVKVVKNLFHEGLIGITASTPGSESDNEVKGPSSSSTTSGTVTRSGSDVVSTAKRRN